MEEVAAAQAGLGSSVMEELFILILMQVRLNTMRSLGTFIGPFGSTLLCVLPEASICGNKPFSSIMVHHYHGVARATVQEGLFNELNSAGRSLLLQHLAPSDLRRLGHCRSKHLGRRALLVPGSLVAWCHLVLES